MTSLVSVIIPNFNCEKHIEKCVKSVINQTYKSIEIIIVDDGSTDKSLIVTEEFLKRDNVKLFTQDRQNAAVARNRGIMEAKGDYILFLDSDDILFPDSVEKLVNCAIRTESDFVMGNMQEMDETDAITKNLVFFNSDRIVSDYRELIGLIPAPSNKFFKASVIRDNNIFFGNVRIGQDLNFFLKYLLCCKKISVLNEYIYAWRDTQGSMSRTMNFKIFDITESFKDVKRFYFEKNASDDYSNYIRMIEYHNYYRQMDKQMNFPKRRVRKFVVEFFRYNIKELGNVTECLNFEQYSDEYKKCNIKLRLKFLYVSSLFRKFYIKKNG